MFNDCTHYWRWWPNNDVRSSSFSANHRPIRHFKDGERANTARCEDMLIDCITILSLLFLPIATYHILRSDPSCITALLTLASAYKKCHKYWRGEEWLGKEYQSKQNNLRMFHAVTFVFLGPRNLPCYPMQYNVVIILINWLPFVISLRLV